VLIVTLPPTSACRPYWGEATVSLIEAGKTG
jgi:hypothetical protein